MLHNINIQSSTKYNKICCHQKTKSDLPQRYLCPGGRFSLEDCLFYDITPTLIVYRGVIPPGHAGGSFVPDRLDPPAT